MSCAAPPKQPRPEAASALAPGFRFHPTDEELVGYYLKRKVVGRPFRIDAISEIDLYKAEPWDLPGKSRIQSRDTEWYFFSALDKKYSNRSRTNRATGSGYWKTTGKDRAVCRGGHTVGMKKTLVFHIGRAPKGERTNWVMHEYRLEDEELARSGVPQDAFVVCRIFQKRGAGPQNGAQYGAPFVEEEWDDDELPILKAEDEDDALSILGNPEPTETDDYNQIEDMGIQGAQTSLLLSTEQDGFNDFFDPDSVLKVCEENLLCDGKDGNIEIHGQQDGQHLEKEFGDCSVADQNQGFAVANDEFLELNDFAYPIDDNLLEDGSCPQEVDNGTNFMSGEISFQWEVQNVGDMSDPVNSSIQSVFSECHTVDDNCFVKFNDLLRSEDSNSVNQGNDGMVYLDAPNHFLDASHGYFKNTNSFVDSTIAESSEPDPVAELIAYFNATENMQPLDLDLTSRTNILDGSNLAPVNGHDIPYQASPKISSTSNSLSSMTPYTDNRPSVGSVNIHRQSEYGGSWKKAFKKRLMNMLDAVPSPPAFAAENSLKQAKSVEQYSAAHTPHSMNIATGMVQIHRMAITGTGKNWPVLKNRGPGFLLACTMGCDETDSFAAHSRMGKAPGGMIAFIMRNSFHLLFLSVLFLAASCKIWGCMYGK